MRMLKYFSRFHLLVTIKTSIPANQTAQQTKSEIQNAKIVFCRKKPSARRLWIGLYRTTISHSSLRWIDDTPFVSGDTSYYQNWYRGQPKSLATTQKCVNIISGATLHWQWADNDCRTWSWAMCEAPCEYFKKKICNKRCIPVWSVPPAGLPYRWGLSSHGIVRRQTPCPVNRITDTCKNITFLHIPFPGGKKRFIYAYYWRDPVFIVHKGRQSSFSSWTLILSDLAILCRLRL